LSRLLEMPDRVCHSIITKGEKCWPGLEDMCQGFDTLRLHQDLDDLILQ
ncbi:hypothetical protein GBF38_016090, partial [Nibea albiflora]